MLLPSIIINLILLNELSDVIVILSHFRFKLDRGAVLYITVLRITVCRVRKTKKQ
jgi:hypothetical protein